MPTVAQFRIDYPEFADPSKYPDSLIGTWLAVATSQVANADRWGAALLTTAQELVCAHYVVIAMRDRAAATNGSIPGQVAGLQTAKSVGDVSVSYDYTSLLLTDAGFWNQTTYGQRYFSLARMIGAGGMQLPTC
jgi:hypothetical protein